MGAPSLSLSGEHEADAEGSLAERLARLAAAVREIARHLVQAEERADLVTEYGHETKPGEPRGVTNAQQASYAAQALAIAKKDPRVDMFVWFVFQDTKTSTWQSGLYSLAGGAKPALARFRAAAKPLDARNAIVNVKGGTMPTVAVSVREFGTNNKAGAKIGVNYKLKLGSKVVGIGQPQTVLGVDGWIHFKVQTAIAKGSTYILSVAPNDVNGTVLNRTLTLKGV